MICETQEEIDYYWDRLTKGGDPNAQQCGWSRTSTGCPGRWGRLFWPS